MFAAEPPAPHASMIAVPAAGAHQQNPPVKNFALELPSTNVKILPFSRLVSVDIIVLAGLDAYRCVRTADNVGIVYNL
jgi:hypothetical protein